MILLDTHVWVNYTAQRFDHLSKAALSRIEDTTEIGVSDISCWEVSMLVQKGRLKLNMDTMDWISDALLNPKIEIIPLTTEILVAAPELPNFHKDPVDRIIATTCYLNFWSLITKDKHIREWGMIKTIW
jgi:PIN domain nuclease of toxin-antitoxin system